MDKIIFSVFLMLVACRSGQMRLVKLEGETMGTTYHISYLSRDGKSFQQETDSLLADFSNSLSTYIPSSVISGVNRADTLAEVDHYFTVVFRKAQEVSARTNGAFDVTIIPLVNAWGFGFAKDTLPKDSSVIDSIRQLVDYTKLNLSERNGKYFIIKQDKRTRVDFDAIAQGYGTDVVSELLERNGIENYMVEIGGEVRAKGKNEHGKWWRIGIDKPVEDTTGTTRELKAVFELKDKSIATSGNYRKFYYKEGKKYSHEIDPHTGYPAMNNLLSVSVVAADCMTADAYATAFMVMGMEKSWQFVQGDSAFDAYFIYTGDDGRMKTIMTAGMRQALIQEDN